MERSSALIIRALKLAKFEFVRFPFPAPFPHASVFNRGFAVPKGLGFANGIHSKGSGETNQNGN